MNKLTRLQEKLRGFGKSMLQGWVQLLQNRYNLVPQAVSQVLIRSIGAFLPVRKFLGDYHAGDLCAGKTKQRPDQMTVPGENAMQTVDRKSTRLNSSHQCAP